MICQICLSDKFFCLCNNVCKDCGDYTKDCQCDTEEVYNGIDFFDSAYEDIY